MKHNLNKKIKTVKNLPLVCVFSPVTLPN